MRVVLTGASGFLGWHTRARLCALTDFEVVPVTRDNWSNLARLVKDAEAVIHVAGVNRADSSEVEQGNVRLAEDLAGALSESGAPTHVVFANSVQAGNGTAYGTGKQRAAEVLETATRANGGRFADIRLPNLFGEHCRPRYNSFVATFVDCVARGEQPDIQDRQVGLLHAQDAAQSLIDALATDSALKPEGTSASVQGVYDTLLGFRDIYRGGDVPALTTKFDIDLFNTFRAALFPDHYPFPLQAHADDRGRLVETVRSHGGQGQTFVSTTRPGVTRGEHFHLSKVERFVVVSGQGRISLRRLFHHEVVSFHVTGEEPVVVDMPTLWVHNIRNTGDEELTTLFWTDSLFDPDLPDTYRQTVLPIGEVDA